LLSERRIYAAGKISVVRPREWGRYFSLATESWFDKEERTGSAPFSTGGPPGWFLTTLEALPHAFE
jgi:hypothetical protein